MAKVQVNLQGAKQKLSVGAVERGRYAASNQMLADMNPFVPRNENSLRMTGHVVSRGAFLEWNTPYAARMFYEQFGNYTTPGTGPRWDLKAEGLFLRTWLQVFTRGANW